MTTLKPRLTCVLPELMATMTTFFVIDLWCQVEDASALAKALFGIVTPGHDRLTDHLGAWPDRLSPLEDLYRGP